MTLIDARHLNLIDLSAPAPIRTPDEIRDVPADERTPDELYQYGTHGPWPGSALPGEQR